MLSRPLSQLARGNASTQRLSRVFLSGVAFCLAAVGFHTVQVLAAPPLQSTTAPLTRPSTPSLERPDPVNDILKGGNLVAPPGTGTSGTGAPRVVAISEVRFSGLAGTNDEYVELLNLTNAPLDISSWQVAASSGTTTTISANTVLPARGHYLLTGNTYGLTALEVGDQTLSAALPDNGGVALKTVAGAIVDAVGFKVAGTGYYEGSGLDGAASNTQHAWVRVPITTMPGVQDTDDNAADFKVVEVGGATIGSTPALLGAPGPHNINSPVLMNDVLKVAAFDPAASTSSAPNRVRDQSASATNALNAAYGTMLFRYRITNTGAVPVTRLRFRARVLTTLNSDGYSNPDQADLRLLSSTTQTVNGETVYGTTLQAPDQLLGGGINSGASPGIVALTQPLSPGASQCYSFLFGVQRRGLFSFSLNLEAVTSSLAVTSMAPTAGWPGDTVTLTGKNFTGTTQVLFPTTSDTTLSATFKVVSNTSLTATVPEGAVDGPITVKSQLGTLVTTQNYQVYIGPATGTYRLTTRGQPNLALDVVNFSNNNGANVQLWTAAQTVNQQWLVERQSDGTLKIRAFAGSNSVQNLDAANGATANGTNVALYQENGNSAQKWYFREAGGGYWRIIPKNAGATSLQTLDIRNGNSAVAGNTTNIYAYYGGNNQVFKLDDPGTAQPTGGIYTLSTRGQPTLALDVDSFKNANSTNVLQWYNTGGANQQWLVEPQGGNLYKIYAYSGVNSLQMLDVANGATANGTNVTTYEDNGNNAQLWYFKDIGGGYWRIIPKNAGATSLQTLDMRNGNNSGAGDTANIYGYYGGNNQVFKLGAVTTPKYITSAKKGLAGWWEKAPLIHPSWLYTWGMDRPGGLSTDVEFVPMMWGYYGNVNGVDTASAQTGVKNFLGFNEPDSSTQANLSVDKALEAWPQIMQKTSLPLGSPAAVHADDQWMRDFMAGVSAKGYRVDFVTIHWYGGNDPSGFIGYVDYIHNLYGKPVWITEFAPADWSGNRGISADQAASFMRTVIPQLNSRSYVQRYAWFSAGTSDAALGNAGLFNDDGSLTALGKLYSRM